MIWSQEYMKKYYENYNQTQYEDIAIKFNCVKEVEARYIQQSEPQDIGNDLIEALIPIKSEEESFEVFEYSPFISSCERLLSPEKRALAVLRLDDYRIGRDFTHLIDREIEIALRRCYRSRKKFNLNKMAILEKTGRYFDDCEYKKLEGQKTQGFTVIGISGGGKSTTISSALYNYPQVIYHTDENSRCVQIVYIKVECPADGSLKSFYNSCLEALESAIGKEIIPNKERMTIADKERLFKRYALRWNLGMIVIEEIQQLSIKREDTMNQFLTLANDTQIPIVYIGTFKALKRIFGIDFRLARRLGNEIMVRRYDKDELWDDMLEELWQYQWLKDYIPLSQELNDTFYTETAGVMDRVINLFEAMQLDAILQKTESIKDITPTYVKNVSMKYFSTTRDILYKLGHGEADIDHWDDLYDQNVDKDIIYEISDKLERNRAKALILNSDRKRDAISICSLRNNIIMNINIMFGEKYPLKDIEKAFDVLKKKHKDKLMSLDETIINGMVLDLIINPESMNKKLARDCNVDYDLPSLEGFT